MSLALGIRRSASIVLVALGVACDDAVAPLEFPVRLTITNHLVAPVTITVDSVTVLGLMGGGASSQLTVSSTARWLTWASAKPLDAQGRLIPDDVSDVRISLNSIDRALDISNVIGGQTYITARFLNSTAAPVSIAVYDGTTVACASRLPAASPGATGFTQIGYYRLQPLTEIRAYRDPTRCEGPYTAWTPSQIREFAVGSGLLTLLLVTAP